MPRLSKKKFKSKNRNYYKKTKRNIKKRKIRKRLKNKKGGYKIVLPIEYFNEQQMSKYNTVNGINHNGVSQGSIHNNRTATGPDLHVSKGCLDGGGALPSEYYGGNSGRYFEAGSPELSTCTHAYGRNITASSGTVMKPPHNMWMGHNIAPYPNFKDMTGGTRIKKSKRNKKNKRNKRNKKSKRNNRNNRNKKSKRN